MKTLEILSRMWKMGAIISLDKNDGKLSIKKGSLITPHTMELAEKHGESILNWFKSYENEDKGIKITKQILHQMCGWEPNEKLNMWICNDITAMDTFYELTVLLTKNGWLNSHDDFRDYLDENSRIMCNELYDLAIKYNRGNK